MELKLKTMFSGIRYSLFALLLTGCLIVSSKSYGQTTNPDTICITVDDFKLIQNDLQILRELDSSNLVVIYKQDTVIAKLQFALKNRESVILDQKTIIKQKDIQLQLTKKKANRDKWLIGGTLGGAVLTTILTLILIK